GRGRRAARPGARRRVRHAAAGLARASRGLPQGEAQPAGHGRAPGQKRLLPAGPRRRHLRRLPRRVRRGALARPRRAAGQQRTGPGFGVPANQGSASPAAPGSPCRPPPRGHRGAPPDAVRLQPPRRRGRTVREFVLGVLVVPTPVSLARSAVMGGTAMNLGLTGQAELSRALAGSGEEGAIFALFDHLPLPPITSVAVMVLIALF